MFRPLDGNCGQKNLPSVKVWKGFYLKNKDPHPFSCSPKQATYVGSLIQAIFNSSDLIRHGRYGLNGIHDKAQDNYFRLTVVLEILLTS